MANLTERLTYLEQLDLIAPKQVDSSAKYAFKHVFTQEAIYSSLLYSDRRRLHQIVGEALERLEAGELHDGGTPLVLAHHFEQSGDKERALKYLQQAAVNAAEGYANLEAEALYTRALALLAPDDYGRRWEFLAGQERTLDRLGRRDQQGHILSQMQLLAELLEDDERRIITHHRRSAYFDKVSEYRAAAEAALVSLYAARRSGNAHLETHSLNLLALAAWRRFDYPEVQQWALQALEALKLVGDPTTRVASLFHLGKAGYRLGQYDRALQHIETARELAGETDNRDSEATSHLVLGWIYQRLGDYKSAAKHYQAKLKIRRMTGNLYGEATALSHLGWLAADQQRPEAGLECCQGALEISYDVDDRENEAYALSGFGLNYEQMGQLDLAAANYQAALSIHTEIGASTLVVFDRAGLARIALAQDKIDLARQHILAVIGWIEAGNAQKFWDPWLIYLSSYRVLTALGDADLACTILDEAYRVLHQRAQAISDKGLRRCFLFNVAANRQIEALRQQTCRAR